MSGRSLMLLAALTLAPSAPGAGDAPIDRATLRGLWAVNVVVDKIAPDLEAAGVTASAVRAHIEDRLTAANIKVDSSKQEFLAVRFTGVRDRRGPFAVAVTLGAYQPVSLARDPKVRTATQTWEVETVLLADPKQVFRAAMESVDELTRGFITAHKSVNK